MSKHASGLNQVYESRRLNPLPSETRGQKRADLRVVRIETAMMKNSRRHLGDSRQCAASRIAERAAMALLRAMEDGIQVPAAFVLDEEDLADTLRRSPAPERAAPIETIQIPCGTARTMP